MFDFPLHAEREYIAAIDIAAIIIVGNGDRLETRVTRDIEKTFTAMQGAVACPLDIVGAWWVRNRAVAKLVAKSVPRGETDLAKVRAIVEAESRRHGSAAVAHALAMGRMRIAGSQIDAALRANGRGELAWFNRAYRAYRTARSGPAMSYQSARGRLRRAVVRRLVVSGGLEFGCDLLPDVFG